jgi:hypothetical protein
MCYIHCFNTNRKRRKNETSCFSTQLATLLRHLSLQHTTYSGLVEDILGLSAFLSLPGAHRFASDAEGLCKSSMLTSCLTPHELRRPCTSQSTINDNSANFRQLPSSIHPELYAYRFPYPWITEKALKWKALPT